MNLEPKDNRKKLGFIGMRVLKTALSVYLCFLAAYIRGQSPLYSTFAAIISTKSDHLDGIKAGKHRMIGTFLGGAFGLIVILIIDFLNIETSSHLAYFIYSLFIIPIIYSNLYLDSADSATLSTIVFISIALSSKEISPLLRVFDRLEETLIGVIISIIVNKVL